MSSTFSELTANIADWMERDDLGSQLATFVSQVEDDIYRELRLEFMLKTLTGTIADGLLATPADFLSLGVLWVDTAAQPVVSMITLDQLLRRYGDGRQSGVPQYVALEGTNLRFGPQGAYDVVGTYYARLPALSAQNETNWLTQNAADCLLYGGLVKAVGYVGHDSRLDTWAVQYGRCMDGLRSQDRQARFTERAPIRAVVR